MEEDDLLNKAVTLYSDDWARVSDMVGTRTKNQCRDRVARLHNLPVEENENEKNIGDGKNTWTVTVSPLLNWAAC